MHPFWNTLFPQVMTYCLNILQQNEHFGLLLFCVYCPLFMFITDFFFTCKTELSMLICQCLFVHVFVRSSGCAQDNIFVRGPASFLWTEATLWLAGWTNIPAAGQYMDRWHPRTVWNAKWQPTRWLPVCVCLCGTTFYDHFTSFTSCGLCVSVCV